MLKIQLCITGIISFEHLLKELAVILSCNNVFQYYLFILNEISAGCLILRDLLKNIFK